MVVVWVHDDSRIVVVVVEGLSSWWRQVGGEGFGVVVAMGSKEKLGFVKSMYREQKDREFK